MFNSATGYRIIQTDIKAFLEGFGFLPYKSTIAYRISSDNILQFIHFQKGDRWLKEQMTISIVLQGLFSPTSSFNLLQPGGRMGNFTETKADKWWLCNTEQSTEKSATEIKGTFDSCLLPFFEKTKTANGICDIIDNSDYRFIWQNKNTFIDRGYFYLKAKQYKKAINTFLQNQPSKVPKFKTLKKLVDEMRYEDIEIILSQNEKHSKEKLKI